MEDLTVPRPSEAEPTPPGSLSRRELLKKAGWAVPAIVALPLLPGSAHAHRHASPGATSPSRGSDDTNWRKTAKKEKKEKAAKAMRKLLRKLFGRR